MILFLVHLLLQPSLAQIQIPKNMNSGDRQTLLQILGYGSMSKVLGDPYPLGGYTGLEVSIMQDVIPTSRVQSLGNQTATRQTDLSYTSLVFGKGLYNDFDLQVQFLPPRQNEEVTGWGGQLRWGFFEAARRPITLTAVAHGNSMNFQNLLTTNTQGLDLVAAYNVDDLTIYTGFGIARVQGVFLGGIANLTDQTEPTAGTDPTTGQVYRQTLQESLSDTHLIAGVNFRLEQLFIAFQIDRVVQTTFSSKLGFRF